MKPNKNVRYITRISNLRGYEFTARICKLTGRLLGVQGGCRRWRNFTEAREHYAGLGKYNRIAYHESEFVRMRDVIKINPSPMNFKIYGDWYAQRLECRKILDRLQTATEIVQSQIRRRLKRKR